MIENIDIGGPINASFMQLKTLKMFLVVADPKDYDNVLDAIQK